jgi:transcription elongation factor Elf1
MNHDEPQIKIEVPAEAQHKFACAACGHETYHEVIAGVNEWGDTPYYSYVNDYWTIRCKGCGKITFCHRSSNSEDFDYDESGKCHYVVTVNLYPGRIAGQRLPKWTYELPYLVRTIFTETHSALCNGGLILAGIGMRAIVEAVCTHRSIKARNLELKIEALREENSVTNDGATILHSLRFMGNAAAHETKAHTLQELKTALEVIENILFNALILPRRAKKLPTKYRARVKSGPTDRVR